MLEQPVLAIARILTHNLRRLDSPAEASAFHVWSSCLLPSQRTKAYNTELPKVSSNPERHNCGTMLASQSTKHWRGVVPITSSGVPCCSWLEPGPLADQDGREPPPPCLGRSGGRPRLQQGPEPHVYSLEVPHFAMEAATPGGVIQPTTARTCHPTAYDRVHTKNPSHACVCVCDIDAIQRMRVTSTIIGKSPRRNDNATRKSCTSRVRAPRVTP